MAKYHISKSGKPALCKVILRECPLGTHYNTKEDAHEAYQAKVSKKYGVLSSVDPDGQKDELKKQCHPPNSSNIEGACRSFTGF